MQAIIEEFMKVTYEGYFDHAQKQFALDHYRAAGFLGAEFSFLEMSNCNLVTYGYEQVSNI